MLGALWYIGTLVGAFMWLLGSKSLYPRLTVPELVAVAVPTGTVLAAWIVYAFGCCLSNLHHQVYICSTLFMAYLVWARYGTFRKNWETVVATFRAGGAASARARTDALWAAAVAGASFILLYPLYSSHMIPTDDNPSRPGEKAIMSGGSCWADLPIHMHIAESFLSGRNQDISWGDMQSPIFAGERLYYPFLPDFHAAVMAQLDGHSRELTSLRTAFLWPGLALSTSFWTLLFLLTLRVTRSRLGGVVACLLTLGAGGTGSFSVFFTSLAAHSGNIFAALRETISLDTAQNSGFSPEGHGNNQIYWFAFLPHVFLPQRGANFAYPMVLAVLLLLWVGTDTSATTAAALASTRLPLKPSHEAHRSFLMHAALLTASLPLVQAHAFVGLGMIIGTLFVLDAHKWLADLRLLGGWVSGGIVAFLFASPQMALYSKQVKAGAGTRFLSTGWIHRGADYKQSPGLWGFGWFWWTSLGPALLLFCLALGALAWDVACAYLLAQKKKRERLYGGYLRSVCGTAAAALGPSLVGAPASGPGVLPKPAPASARAGGYAAAASASSSSSDGGVSSSRKRLDATAEDPFARLEAAEARINDEEEESKYAKASAAALASINTVSADATLVEHLVLLSLQQLPDPVAEVLAQPTLLNNGWLDAELAPCNELAVTGRALDALKLALGGGLVFLVGNYVKFQPWDRDNCKLFYLWVFIYSMLAGPLLAAPFEALFEKVLKGGPGYARLLQLAGVPPETVVAEAVKAAEPGVKAKAEDGGSGARGGAGVSPTQRKIALSFGGLGVLIAPALVFLATATGLAMVLREVSMYHVLLDSDQLELGAYIREHVSPKHVILHNDIHITPSGCIAGRPSLVGYTGWTDSHGYDYGGRHADRERILANCLKDSDPGVYDALRRWGVRYIASEWLPRHDRPKQKEWEAAKALAEADPNAAVGIPAFDPALYLDGSLKLLKESGRYMLLEVQGYGPD